MPLTTIMVHYLKCFMEFFDESFFLLRKMPERHTRKNIANRLTEATVEQRITYTDNWNHS